MEKRSHSLVEIKKGIGCPNPNVWNCSATIWNESLAWLLPFTRNELRELKVNYVRRAEYSFINFSKSLNSTDSSFSLCASPLSDCTVIDPFHPIAVALHLSFTITNWNRQKRQHTRIERGIYIISHWDRCWDSTGSSYLHHDNDACAPLVKQVFLIRFWSMNLMMRNAHFIAS